MELPAKWFHVNDVQPMDPTMAARSSSGNPFLDAFPEPDPICKINLTETSEFVGSFPTVARTSLDGVRGLPDISTNRRRDWANSSMQLRRAELQTPCTPGRPIFGFSSVAGGIGSHHNCSGNSSGSGSGSGNQLVPPRRSFPSKWDDAEKWVVGPGGGGGSSRSSPAHPLVRTTSNSSILRKQALLLAEEAEKSRVTTEEDVTLSKSKLVTYSNDNGVSAIAAAEVVLKDKFTDEVQTILPKFRCSDLSSKEGFLFGGTITEPMKDKATDETHRRDIGTEMTPLGSSTNSRCHTPFKSSSPARHNTPASRSGPLSLEDYQDGSGNACIPTIDIGQLNECHHLAKLQLGGRRNNHYDSVTSNWSSKEEEEEEVSKSLRHFESNNGNRGFLQKSGSQTRAAAWEEEEQLKCCLRYQREEAKIQAWVNLESAKAEAQSRKLEVKIQKMRSKLEEKLMRRMGVVHRKAEEWRAEAKQQHTDQVDRTAEHAKKNMSRHHLHHGSCGCFP